jgi:hypothetical protein
VGTGVPSRFESIGYTHRSGNHSVSFVNPTTGDHTRFRLCGVLLRISLNRTTVARVINTISPTTCSWCDAGRRVCLYSTNSLQSSRPRIGPAVTPLSRQPGVTCTRHPWFTTATVLAGKHAHILPSSTSCRLSAFTYRIPCSRLFHDAMFWPTPLQSIQFRYNHLYFISAKGHLV